MEEGLKLREGRLLSQSHTAYLGPSLELSPGLSVAPVQCSSSFTSSSPLFPAVETFSLPPSGFLGGEAEGKGHLCLLPTPGLPLCPHWCPFSARVTLVRRWGGGQKSWSGSQIRQANAVTAHVATLRPREGRLSGLTPPLGAPLGPSRMRIHVGHVYVCGPQAGTGRSAMQPWLAVTRQWC